MFSHNNNQELRMPYSQRKWIPKTKYKLKENLQEPITYIKTWNKWKFSSQANLAQLNSW